MNSQLDKFARKKLKDGLAQVPPSYQLTFKRMYSHTNLDADINDVVDRMPSDKLDWAMTQVQNGIKDLPEHLLRVLTNIIIMKSWILK